MSDYVWQNSSYCSFKSNESWAVLSYIERSIEKKVAAIGYPLKDTDIQIYRGVLTGCNDAFIIDDTTRSNILNNCMTSDERIKTEELIRPILRGRDINKYSYNWANLYLIWIPWHFPLQNDVSIQGASQIAENMFKILYPSIYNYLLKFKPQLSSRNKSETGIRYEWYALQRWGANYWDKFSRPKILWKRVGSIIRFAYDESGIFLLDSTCMATGDKIQSICCILNSKMGHFLLKDAPQTGTGDLLISVQAVEPIRVPHINESVDACLTEFILGKSSKTDEEINEIIFDLYKLSEEEKNYIRDHF